MGSCSAVLVDSLEPAGCRCPGGRVPGTQAPAARAPGHETVVLGGGGVVLGSLRGGPPRDVAVPAHLETAERSQPGAGSGKEGGAWKQRLCRRTEERALVAVV